MGLTFVLVVELVVELVDVLVEDWLVDVGIVDGTILLVSTCGSSSDGGGSDTEPD